MTKLILFHWPLFFIFKISGLCMSRIIQPSICNNRPFNRQGQQQGWRNITVNWTKCTKDERFIWNEQTFISRLEPKYKKKKQWLFWFWTCLCGCITLTHFYLDDEVRMQKRELVKSPRSKSSVFVSWFFGGYFSLQGIYVLPLASQTANSASNQNVFDVFWRWNQNRRLKNRNSCVWIFMKDFNAF